MQAALAHEVPLVVSFSSYLQHNSNEIFKACALKMIVEGKLLFLFLLSRYVYCSYKQGSSWSAVAPNAELLTFPLIAG